jgi:3-(3-hydroxy-phenyl)propionate hydroxylase
LNRSEPNVNYDVAIVGAGPIGAFLANRLGCRGRRVLLIDKEPKIYALPRAVHFDGEVMRAFQSIGLADEIAAISRASSKGMHFISSTGQTLLIRRGYDGAGPQGWANNYYVHQPDLEAVLRSALARHQSVVARLGVEVTAIKESADAVAVELTSGSERPPQTLTANYLIGCDGARSYVRRVIGCAREDLGLHQPWLVVDALMRPTTPRAKNLPEYTVQLCDPNRLMTLVYVGGKRRRWEIMLMPGDDASTIANPDSIWRLISRWITPEDATLERAAIYTFHSVIAKGWRKGRLLLAGDACHQTPPFLGQGMCAGIRDCVNLAWKLEAVFGGRARDSLLDTYESERSPHVRAFIQLAVDLGGIIQTTDPEIARKRDASFACEGPRMFDFPQPQLGPGVWINGGMPAGQVFPQPRLDDGRRLDEVAGSARFCLLGDASFLREGVPQLKERIAAAGVVVVTQSGREICQWLSRHKAHGVLLRPDRYVFTLLRTNEDLQRALGALEQHLIPRPWVKAV